MNEKIVIFTKISCYASFLKIVFHSFKQEKEWTHSDVVIRNQNTNEIFKWNELFKGKQLQIIELNYSIFWIHWVNVDEWRTTRQRFQ